MNHIYKVIWSKVKNSYVVVSETAKRNGKSSRTGAGKKLAAALTALVLCTGITTGAMAADTAIGTGKGVAYGTSSEATNEKGVAVGKNAKATSGGAIAVGNDASTTGASSIAIGDRAKIFGKNPYMALVIGENAQSAYGSIVIGMNAKDYDTDPAEAGSGIYIGANAKSLGGPLQVVLGNGGQVKGQGATAIGTWTKALDFQASAVGQSAQALGDGSSAFGADSIAEFNKSTALGANTNARGYRSLAVGKTTVAAGSNSVAIGYQSYAHNGYIDKATYDALSAEEQAKYFRASGVSYYFLKDTAAESQIWDSYLNTAVGSYSRAFKEATALGAVAMAQEGGTAVGNEANANAKGAASFGYQSRANVENGVALGAYSVADREKGQIGYALGGDNSTVEKALESAGQKARYDELTSIIDPLKDEYNGLVDAYYDATTSEDKTEAMNNIKAWNGEHSDFHTAVEERTQLIDAWQSGNGAVSVGKIGGTRQITNVAAGSEDSDAVNVAQLKAAKVEVIAGDNVTVTSDNSEGYTKYTVTAKDTKVTGLTLTGNTLTLKQNGLDDLKVEGIATKADVAAGAVHYLSVNSDDSANPTGTNWNNDGAKGENSIAIGKNASTKGKGSVAIGNNATIDGGGAIAVGNDAKVFNVNMDDGLAIGNGAESSHGSIVIGRGAKDYDTDTAKSGSGIYIGVNAKNSGGGTSQTVVGHYGEAQGDDSIAVGFSAHALGQRALAVGANSESSGESSSSFGSSSVAESNDSTALGAYANGRGAKSLAVGTYGVAAGHNSVAIGYQSFAHNGYINANAYEALSSDDKEKYFEAFGVYFLKDTAAENRRWDSYLNTAVGSYSKAFKEGTALGAATTAQEGGTAVGNEANANAKGAASFGYQSRANVENGVALGAYSVADREKGQIGYALGGDNSTVEKALESAGQKARYDELTSIIDPLKGEYTALVDAYNNASGSAARAAAQQDLINWTGEHPDFYPALTEMTQLIDAWQSGNGAVSVGNIGATRQITNVAAGSEDSDAVNVAQLKALDTKVETNTQNITDMGTTLTQMDSRIGELGGRVNEVGASAAALAALHPLEFDPEDKWNFAAGIGHYKSKSSAALGAFYRMNENTLLSVGGTFGGEKMWNAGVSLKLGSGTSSVSTSRTAMAKEIQDLKTQNEEIRGRNQAIEAENKEIKNELAVLKQQIAKLMAK